MRSKMSRTINTVDNIAFLLSSIWIDSSLWAESRGAAFRLGAYGDLLPRLSSRGPLLLRPSLLTKPLVDLFSRHILGYAIALLNEPFEALAFASGFLEIVIS